MTFRAARQCCTRGIYILSLTLGAAAAAAAAAGPGLLSGQRPRNWPAAAAVTRVTHSRQWADSLHGTTRPTPRVGMRTKNFEYF